MQAHQRKLPGITTRYAGASGIALNGLFAGKIWRTPPWDRLIQSYLADFAFTPSWNFSKEFSFKDEMLVPWTSLREWIPRRVRAWIAQLEREITPSRYRFLRTSICSSLNQIRHAGAMGMDMVQIGVGRNILGLPVLADEGGKNTWTSLLTALLACRRAVVGVYLILHDRRVIPWLARILGRGDWSDYLMTGATRPDWLAEIKARLPHYRSVLRLATPSDDVLAKAQAVGANYVHLTRNAEGWLTPARIWALRQAGIGIVSGPVESGSALDRLRTLGIEAIVVRDPGYLGRPGG